MMEMLDCDAVMRQVWDFLDGELPPERMQALEAHIAMCERCGGHVKFERSFKAALRAAREDGADSTELGARVLAALRREGFTDPRGV